jgi:Ca2+-binding EF-hand superfamily protein
MKTISVSFLVVGMLLPALCLGQDEPAKGQATREKRHRAAPKSPEQVWELTDVDRDGLISKEEFSAMPRVQKLPEEKREIVFSRLDKDADAQLSKEELSRFGKPHGAPPMQRLWELDADQSGGISSEEFNVGQLFKKLAPEKREQMFRRLDTDGDGSITPQDRPVPPPKRPNAKKGPRSAEGDKPSEPRTFNRKLDLDGDGALSFEEFRKGANLKTLTEDQQEERFEKLDRNGDLKISAADFPPPPPPTPDSPPAEVN